MQTINENRGHKFESGGMGEYMGWFQGRKRAGEIYYFIIIKFIIISKNNKIIK